MRLPAGFAEVPCARCGTFTKGLQFGELCPDCLGRQRARANRLARLISLAVTVLFALYVTQRVSLTSTARLWAAAGAVLVYFSVRRIVKQIVMQRN